MKYNFDCVVIGAGIAGMTAAIYLKRANLNILILDCDTPGGLLNKIDTVNNYPGCYNIKGADLAYNIYSQLKDMNIEIKYGKVLSINDHEITTDIEKYTTSKIIIATGRQTKKINNLEDLDNVSYCVVCDANLYANKTVAIIANDEHSIDEAIYLSNVCKNVIFLCNNLEVNRLNNVKICSNYNIIKFNIDNNKLQSIVTDKEELFVDGLFISLGYEPKANFLDKIQKDNNYILVNDKMQTNIDYIYACGDIIKKDVYQLTTAVGDATVAAINVIKSI